MGSGIEVFEEGKRTRVVMPASAPARWIWRSWYVVGLLVGVVVFAFWQWTWLERRSPGLERLAVAWGVLVVLGLVKLALLTATLGPTLVRNRVELVVDRHGVAQRGWGPFFLWRVRLARARAVVVCPPLEAWQEPTGMGRLATVRVVSWRVLRGFVWGAYEREVATQAAAILAEQIERVRRVVGVEGPAVALRDGLGEGVKGRAEEVLEMCRVRVERGAEGVRMEVAPWTKLTFPCEDEGYLAPPLDVAVLAIGMAVSLVGGLGGAEIATLSKEQGVWNAVGMGMAIVPIVVFFAWMLVSQWARLAYRMGSGGVEQVERSFGMRWRRRWRREEIESVYVRKALMGGGRVWAVGIRQRGGRKVDLAMGWRWTAEAFAEVLERELGMGETEEVRGGAG